MKLAILGTDSDVLQLALAARGEQHELVWLGDVRPKDAEAIGRVAPGLADRASEWELLLGRGVVDAVLVGMGTASGELHVERVKRLVAEGIPLLIVYPAFESVLPYYELDMIRRESRGIVQHYNPLTSRSVANALSQWLELSASSIGQIHQVSCERRVTHAEREAVLAHLARDVELLTAVAGDIRRVTAIGPTADTASFASLQIQMIASDAASLRWSVGHAAAAGAGFEISLLGENGTGSLRISEGPESAARLWKIDSKLDANGDNRPVTTYEPASEAIARLADSVSESQTGRLSDASTWESATRAMEVVDAAEISLQKGRTIEVYQQQLTERLAFRGTMAALGCGLLLLAFMAVVAVAVLGGAEGIVRQRLAPAWPIILLAVLAFFLLLQAVPLLVRKPNRDPDGDTPR